MREALSVQCANCGHVGSGAMYGDVVVCSEACQREHRSATADAAETRQHNLQQLRQRVAELHEEGFDELPPHRYHEGQRLDKASIEATPCECGGRVEYHVYEWQPYAVPRDRLRVREMGSVSIAVCRTCGEWSEV